MTRAALIAVALCAAFAAAALYLWPDMYEAERVETVTITWVRKVPTACGPQEKDGCAQWSADRKHCTVTMPADARDAVVAHEIKHCYGWAHRE